MRTLSPIISVVTVVFNDGKLLQNTINSVAEQSINCHEFIVIDGGSDDNTVGVLKDSQNVITTWVSEQDNGIYDAMNKGAEMSKGEYLWFINAGDCLYDANVLEHVCQELRDKPDILFGDVELYSLQTDNVKRLNSIALTKKTLAKGMIVSHQAVLVRKELFEKYDLSYKIVADHDWLIRMVNKAKYIKQIDRILVRYLIGGYSHDYYYRSWAERISIIREHYNIGTVLLNYVFFIRDTAKRWLKCLLRVEHLRS